MWQKLPAFIRSWSILIVGVVLILSLFYLASSQWPSSQPSAAALSKSSEPAPVTQPNLMPNASAATHVERPTAATASAPTQAPALSHERMAATPAAAQTSGQATPAPKTEAASISADVATGKLVFRKCQA